MSFCFVSLLMQSYNLFADNGQACFFLFRWDIGRLDSTHIMSQYGSNLYSD